MPVSYWGGVPWGMCEVASGCHQVHSWRVPSPLFKNFGSGIRFSMQDHAVLLKAFLLVYRFLTSDAALHSAICTIGSRGVTSIEVPTL